MFGGSIKNRKYSVMEYQLQTIKQRARKITSIDILLNDTQIAYLTDMITVLAIIFSIGIPMFVAYYWAKLIAKNHEKTIFIADSIDV